MNLKLKTFEIIGVLILSYLVTTYLSVRSAGVMEDDSFFYAQIAYNLGLYNFSSFDGINITDGYHIFWTFLLSLVSKIVSVFSEDKITHLFFFNFSYIMVGYFISSMFKGIKFKILSITTFMVSVFLMETAILSFFLLIIMNFLHKGKYQFAVIISLLIPIIRIDSSIIIFSLPLYFLFVKDKKWFLFSILSITLGIIIHFCILFNISGEFATVSSLIKSQDKFDILNNFKANFSISYSRIILSILYLGLSILLIYKSKKNITKKHLYLFSVFVIFGYIFLLIHLLFNNNLRNWYFLPSLFISLFVFQKLILPKEYCNFLLLVFVIFITKKGYSFTELYNQNKNEKVYVSKLKEIVPPDESIYLIDGTGYIGYYSERKIVNGDGLVNSHSYANNLLRNNLKDYLKKNKIKYVADNGKKQEYLINYHGLVVRYDEVKVLISKSENLHYSLYKLK